MKVIINREEFLLSEEKCKGQNLDLNISGYFVNLNYDKNTTQEFLSDLSCTIISHKIEHENGHTVCVPIILSSLGITAVLFIEELKEKLTPYLQ